jgi:hypothetical protein
MVIDEILDIGRWEADLPALRLTYASAPPFPHIILDDVLHPDVFERAVREFPDAQSGAWLSYIHVNERKHGNVAADSWPPTLRTIAEAMTSDRFVRFLDDLTGHDGLLADWSMDGGGLHQTRSGGHLNIHADFSAHHTHERWARKVNVLLYLNDAWDPSWGGELELWERDMSRCASAVAPVGNRALIFTTSLDSFHGHPDPLRCPPDVTRKSMALYYFVEEAAPVVRSTNYRPRPSDGWRRFAIGADREALRIYDKAKRKLGAGDAVTTRVLRTLSRRSR